MAPPTPLPYDSKEFDSTDSYVDSLLEFCAASTVFQTLCGGVHILDFFTKEPSLYHTVIPSEWRTWLMSRETLDLINLFLRDDLDEKTKEDGPPESLMKYIKDIRRHSLQRTPLPKQEEATELPRQVSVGMIPKKIHEVSNFADYVVKVASDYSSKTGKEITHFIDFGSGQNYLGRTLASAPYNKHIIAVEGREHNISGAKKMDVFAKVAEKEKVMRNKRLYRQHLDSLTPTEKMNDKMLRRVAKPQKPPKANEVDMRPPKDLETIYTPVEGKGYIQYVEHIVQDGDLSDVVSQIENMKISTSSSNSSGSNTPSSEPVTSPNILPNTTDSPKAEKEINLMAISIHSCGNLSHHGIRSLLLNPSVSTIAIIGCCYNLLTSSISPPTSKHPLLRPSLIALNASTTPTHPHASLPDPHGYPMSLRLRTHNETGIPLNITSRMMAVQAPANWTKKESDAFFTRHFYRALLQRIFLDWGVVRKMKYQVDLEDDEGLESTEPIIIGSLRKPLYNTFLTYVRGAISKLQNSSSSSSDPTSPSASDSTPPAPPLTAGIPLYKLDTLTDEDIEAYAERFKERKKELSITWSLMAFSAGVVESLIVVDRWLWLKEQEEVAEAWVESVFEYGISPRNLVVVGVKKYGGTREEEGW